MPRVQYVNMMRGINETRTMPTPKRIGEMRYWLKGAIRLFKDCPKNIAESEGMADNSIGSDGWFVASSDADAKWVRFDLENRLGEKAQIVIDRTFKGLG